jgi:hypothetical protein
MVHSLSVNPTSRRLSNTFDGKKSIIGSDRFRTSFERCCAHTIWRSMNGICGISLVRPFRAYWKAAVLGSRGIAAQGPWLLQVGPLAHSLTVENTAESE